MKTSCLLDSLPIATERLVIRKYTPEDIQDYFEIFGNPNISKYDEFLPIDIATAKINVCEILDWYESFFHEQSFAVELPTIKKAIGCLYYIVTANSDVCIGYHFHESFHGKGYALESVKAYVNWLVDQSLGQIVAISDPANKSSIKLLEKIGFQFERKQIVTNKLSVVVEEWVYVLKK